MKKFVSIENMDPLTAGALGVFGTDTVTYKVKYDIAHVLDKINDYNAWAHKRFREFIHSLILQYFLSDKNWKKSEYQLRLSSLEEDLRGVDAHIMFQSNRNLAQVDFTWNPSKITAFKSDLFDLNSRSHRKMLMVDHLDTAGDIAQRIRKQHNYQHRFNDYSDLREYVLQCMQKLGFQNFERTDFSIIVGDNVPHFIKHGLKI